MKLQNNPFFILGLPCSSGRREIVAAAEELSFLLDADTCSNAQNELINLNKRLSAELGWFLDIEKADIQAIQDTVNNNNAISTDGLSSVSKLNATLYNFSISREEDSYELGYSILDIDEQYSALDFAEITADVNRNRTAAKIAAAQENDISEELNRKRDDIRQAISDRLATLDQGTYIELITMLAEKCIADDDYEDGIVLSDVVDQYEVNIQAQLEENTERIEKHIDRIKHIANDEAIGNNIKALIRQVQKWDKLAQPLQLKSQASGMPHKMSEHLGRELRELALFLHNEKGLSEDALILVDAMQDVFAELSGLAELFETDSSALNNLIKGNAEAEAVLKDIQALQSLAENTKAYATTSIIDTFILRVTALDRRIKALNIDSELKTQVRQNLCYMARDVAITLHNDKNQTDYASKIANALKMEFLDISSLCTTLAEDCDNLSQQLMYKQMIQRQQAQEKADKKAGTIIRLALVGIFILILIFSSLDGDSSRSAANSSASAEVLYSSYSAQVGDEVYVDIVSIFPQIGVYSEGSVNYSHFVCECQTSYRTTVWVYMTCSEYQSNFDSSASTSIYSTYADEVTFSSSIRIHGTVKTADSITPDLSSDTGTYVIDFSSVGNN